jgi:hypothetical protein
LNTLSTRFKLVVLLSLLILANSYLNAQCTGSSVSLGADQYYCAGTPVTLTAALTNPPTGTATYAWTFQGNPILPSPTGTTYTIPANQSGTYGLTVTYGPNCVLTDDVVVGFLSVPTIGSSQCISAGNTANLSVNFIPALPSSVTPTLAWTGPNGFSSSLANPTFNSFNAGLSGTYTVTVSYPSGSGSTCTDSLASILYLTPAIPTFSIPTNGCLGTNYTPTGFSAQPNTTYSWSISQSSNSSGLNGTTPVFNFTNSGTNTITVTAAQNGCSSSSSGQGISILNLSLNNPDIAPTSNPNLYLDSPVLFGGALTYKICGSNNVSSVQISNYPPSSNNSATQYSFTWGNNPPANFASGSTTTQSILIGNNPFSMSASHGGCTTSINYNIYVGSNPYVSVGVGNSTGLCPDQNVIANITPVGQLGQQNSPGTTYSLYFSNNPNTLVQSFTDLTSTTAAQPVVFNQSSCGNAPLNNCYPSQANVYYAFVVATNACDNSCANSPAITINDKPDANFTVSKSIVCPNSNITLTNAGTTGNTISGSATSGYSCSTNTKIKYVITPNAGFSVVSGDLGGNSGNFNSWTGTNSVVLNFTTPGTYTIKQYAQSNNCGPDSLVKTVCVINPPTSSIAVPNSTSVCSPASLTLSSNSILPTCGTTPILVAYSWTVTNPTGCSSCSNTIGSSTSANSNFTFTNNSNTIQTFIVNLSVTPLDPVTNLPLSNPGCSNSSSISIQVYPSVQITQLTTCNGTLNWNLNSQVNVPSTFTWQATVNNNVNGETTTLQTSSSIIDVLINTSSSSQSVTYTVNAVSITGACTASNTFTVNLVTPLVVQPLTNQTICIGGGLSTPLVLTPSGGSGTPAFSWTLNSSTTPVATTPSYSPPTFNTAGTYLYTGTVSSGPTGCVQTVSQSATITVVADPTITTQPVGASYCQNASPVTPLSVIATGGSGTFNYQWYSNTNNINSGGQAITGATLSTFTPPNASTGIVYYYCVITQTGLNCNVTSNVVQVVVNPAPTISTQPQNQTICVGGSLSALSVGYNGGSGTPTYQWYSNTTAVNTGGTILSGETNATFNLPSGLNNTAASSYYYCVINFGTGSGCTVITSNVASIAVLADPTFTVQPTLSQTICEGGSINALSVTISGGSGTPSYQWYTVSGTNYTAITTNGTAATYTPPIFSNALTFNYAVLVTQSVSGCMSTYSANATVNVVLDPNVSAPSGASYCQNTSPVAPLTVTASNGNGSAYTYQWFSNSTNINSGGNPQASSNNPTFTPPVNGIGTLYYYCLITSSPNNSGCSTASTTATITVNAAPAFATQPLATQTVCLDGTFSTLTVTTQNGTGTPTFQWYSNTTSSTSGGTPISGATTASYTPVATAVGTTYYYCIATFATGGCSNITSTLASAIVVADPLITIQPISTQSICVGGNISSALTASATGGTGTLSYQWSNATGAITGATSQNYTPPTFSTVGQYNYTITITQNGSGCNAMTSQNAVIDVVADPIISTQPIGAAYCQNASPVTALTVTASGGTGSNYSYQWFNGTAQINGATSSTYAPTVASTGSIDYTCLVTIAPTTSGCAVTSSIATITVNTAPAFATQPLATQTVCLDGTFSTLTVTTQNGTGTPTFQWYSNTTSSTSGGTPISGATTASYTPVATAVGTTYYYCIATFATGGCSNITSTLASAIVVADPLITIQPISTQSICVGGNISSALTASATGGTGTLSYQWSNATGAITGATSQNYTPPTFSTVGQYNYTITITQNGSGCNAMTSQNAVIDVVADPIISTQPIGAAYCQNASPVTPLTVSATGGIGTFSYQWYSNSTNSNSGGTLIPSATSSSYTPPLAIVGTKYYYCVIIQTGLNCEVTSNTAEIIVNLAPTFTTQPIPSQTICLNGTLNPLSVVYQNGTGVPTYQWYSNSANSTSGGTIISGATASTYSPPSNAVGTTYYYCVATFSSGGCTAVTSTLGTVVILADPTISAQPISSQSICVGGTIATALTASSTGGTGTTSYQWSNSTGTILGATSQTYLPPSFSNTGQNNYTVTITLSGSGCDAMTSNVALIDVVSDPTVSIQPQGTSYCQNGSPVTPLTVAATGGLGTFSYQWYSNTVNNTTGGSLIPLASSSSYIPSVSTVGTIYYYCVITQSGLNCGVTSNTAAIIVNPAPTFATQPIASQTVCVDGTFNALTVAYQNGTGTPTYQWFSNSTSSTSNGTILPNETNASYTPPSNIVGTTYYYCVATFASGGCSGITSTLSTAIVVADPTISIQPIPTQSICVGGTIATALTASSTGGTGTTSYQWSNSTGAILGATNQTYLPPAFTTVGAYTYLVTITLSGSGCNAAISQNAVIDVVADPVVSVQPISASYCQNGTPVTTLTVGANGGIGTFSYQWYSNNSNSNIGGTILTGATTSTYTPSVANIGTIYYYCVITQSGLNCGVTSNTAGIVVNQAPSFLAQPISQTICSGGVFDALTISYQFGTGVPTYQWFSNTTNSYTGAVAIAGANVATYQPSSITTGSTYYFCAISFSFGGCTNITSNISNQVVVVDPSIVTQPLINQTICVGGTIPSQFNIIVTGGTGTTSYQWSQGVNQINNATQSTYLPVTYLNSGIYTYQVNINSTGVGCDALVSQQVTVEVLNDPLVTTPIPAIYCQNAAIVTPLQVNVNGGSGTINYQWYYSASNTNSGGIQIAGAASSTYTPSVGLVGTSYYYCIVTQSTPNCANVSDNASIQINQPPTISAQPIANQTLCEGGTPITLQVSYINGTNSATYQWYESNTNSNTGGTPLLNETSSSYVPPTVLIGSMYYYCVITFQQGGCSTLTSTTGQVTMVVDPAINTQPLNAQEICQGNTINSALNFTYSGGTGNAMIAWFLNASPPVLINGITTTSYLPIPFNVADTFSYYATLTFDGVGCNSVSTQLSEIIVHPTPYALNLNDTIVVCNHGNLAIPITSTVTSTFVWYSTNNPSVTGESFLNQTSYSIDDSLNNNSTNPQFLTYTVTPTSFPYGCVGPDSIVTVQVQPDVILSMNAAMEICSDSPVNAILTSNVPSTFTWFVSVNNSNVTGESIIPSSNSIVNDVLVNTSTTNQVVVYSVFPISILGQCPGLAQPLVVTVKPPIQLLNPDTLTICSGQNTNINLVANTNVQFNWYASPSLNVLNETTNVIPSSLINDVLVNPTNTVETVTYNVIGTSTANGCSSPVLPLYVVVNPIPELQNVNPIPICNGAYLYPVSLQTSVTGGTTNWTVLNNNIGIPSTFGSNTLPGFAATNNTIITQTGQVSVTPIFTNNSVTCIGSDTTLFINVLPTPSVNPIADIVACNLEQVPLTPVTGPVQNTIFQWINANINVGLNVSGIGDIPIFVGQNPGTLPITGTVSVAPSINQSNVTCQGTPIDFTITINPSPTLLNSDIEICDGNYTNILLNANISSTFIWNATINPNVYGESTLVQTSAFINDQLTLAGTTEQTVIYNVTPISTPYGCYGNDTTINVLINPLPIVDFTIINPILCDQSLINFQNNSVGPLAYNWTFGDGDSSFLFNPVHEYTTFSSYLVTLSAIDQITGCINEYNQTLLINQTPEPDFILSDSLACKSLDVVFTAVDLNPTWQYQWDFGDGSSSNQFGQAGNQFVTNGCFNVSLVVTTPEGCTSDSTQLSAVCIYPEPMASFSIDDAVISSIAPDVTFFNTSVHADTYLWGFGDNTTSITENPMHLYPSDPATYVIILTASNFIGCQDTAALTVTVFQDLAIYVPNTFTPDGNEYNQSFLPILTEGFKKDNYHLTIFNRWGEIVFESYDPQYGWDGSYSDFVKGPYLPLNGKGFFIKEMISPNGTYTWKISIEVLQTGEIKEFLGHVNLLR